jgi:beta-ureidopropionase
MKKDLSRRSFIKNSALTTGIAAMSPFTLPGSINNKLPREVWIAGVSQMDMHTDTPELMLDEIVTTVRNGMVHQPDVLCLPETFPVVNHSKHLNLSQKLEYSDRAVKAFSNLAREFKCNVICPVYTTESGKNYNSAVFLDRKGFILGEYRKMHLTLEEIESGLTPGPIDPPVFHSDFGKTGAQICFDIYWDDGWQKLAEKGAEIVFWPSAFAGGTRVNMKALAHQFVVVSSTRKNTSKICDIRGEQIHETGFWDKNFFCGRVNLEKVLVDTWPHVSHFSDIRKKYGRKITISTLHEEQFSVIESLSPELFVADILKEFGIKPYKEEIEEAQAAQIKARI